MTSIATRSPAIRSTRYAWGDSLAAGPACVLAVRVGVGEPCRARRLPLRGLVAVAFSVGTSGCGLFGPNETCGPYPDWSTSPYILPYDPGQSFGISQGNCTSGSHQGQARHAYDFEMPLRTRILSIADGVVIDLRDDRPEGTDRIQDDNLILVRHDDETIATYVHIAAQEEPGEALEGEHQPASGLAVSADFQHRRGDGRGEVDRLGDLGSVVHGAPTSSSRGWRAPDTPP
jgi:hypothetical protein